MKTLMRFLSIGASCFAMGVPVLALAQSMAPITDVLLYPGGATIVRSVKLVPGNAVIAIARLPASFDSKTLRIEASSGIRVGETVIKDVAKTEAFNPKEAEVEAKIQTLQDQQAALDAESKAAELVKDYLGRIGGAGAGTTVLVSPDAKAITTQSEAIGRAANDALGKIQRLEVQKRDLEKKVQALQSDLARLRTGDKNSRQVSVNVAAEKAGTLKVSYQISNAGWRPIYRGELLSGSSKVELERSAIVSQKTGEDWVNVRLTLSTSQPSNSPAGAQPRPWLLSYYPPQTSSDLAASYRGAPAPAPAAAPVMAMKASLNGANEDAEYRAPTFETQSTFATEFEVPARLNVPSDGLEVSIQLAKYVLPVKQFVRVTPRMGTVAYVIAQGERPQGVWPVGSMQLFRDRNYVGMSQWNLADKERFTFSFGRDDLVRVANNPVKQDAGTTGVFDKKNERRVANVFSISSAHQGPIDIEVLEATPIATSDEIKVLATFDPKPTVDTWNNERGVIAWERTLKPNEMAKYSADYVIEFPKEGSINGLR